MIFKYKLRDNLMPCARANHFRELNDMRLVIKRVVWQKEKDCWKVIQILYPALYVSLYSSGFRLFYSVVADIPVSIWWIIAAIIPRCTKWISNVVCVVMGAELRALQCNFGRTICKLCDINRKYVTLHALSECPSLNDARRNGWRDMAIIMPDVMGRHVDTFPVENKLQFYLDLVETTSMNVNWYTVILPNLSHIYIYIYIYCKSIDSIQSEKWTRLTLQDNVAYDGLGIRCTYIYILYIYIYVSRPYAQAHMSLPYNTMGSINDWN